MEMNGSRTVPADIETTWRALNDPEVLKACIAGCESVERVSDHEYRMTMTARVGPVSARFTGRIIMTDVVAPTSYTLSFEGQGGAAGFAKGEARVALADNKPGTRIGTMNASDINYAVRMLADIVEQKPPAAAKP